MRFFQALLLILISKLANAQSNKVREDVLQFEKIVKNHFSVKSIEKEKDSLKIVEIEKFNQKVYEKVIKQYDDYILKYSDSELVFKALNNKAEAELSLSRVEDAKHTSLIIINSDANDGESIAHTIFSEPYANYKNRAVKRLAQIEFDKKNYIESIKYLDLTKIHKYKHFCGNEIIEDMALVDYKYAQCYYELKNYKKVNNLLIHWVFDYDYTDMGEFLYKNILKMYKKEQVKLMFKQSLKNMIVEKKIVNKNTHYCYYINFLNKRISLSLRLYKKATPQEIQDALDAYVKESSFCKLLI